jgi:hypothetical protein
MKNRRRFLIVAAVVLGLAVASVGIAYAITNGEPDGDAHPYVALLVFGEETGDGFVPYWRCSGSLIAPDVILTAGHCTDGATGARVWFDEGPILRGTWDPDVNPTCAGETGYPCTGDAEGTPFTNPKYRSPENPYGGGNGLPAFSYRDVGIVVLDEDIDVGGFADLPTAGLVDTLKNKTALDLVGYGVQYKEGVGIPPYYRWTGPRVRLYAPSELVSGKFVHSEEFIRISLNAAQGKGGTCFGDSGGPDLKGGTDTVLAVNSYVTNVNCSGVGYSSRVDIQEVLDWINSLMP